MFEDYTDISDYPDLTVTPSPTSPYYLDPNTGFQPTAPSRFTIDPASGNFVPTQNWAIDPSSGQFAPTYGNWGIDPSTATLTSDPNYSPPGFDPTIGSSLPGWLSRMGSVLGGGLSGLGKFLSGLSPDLMSAGNLAQQLLSQQPKTPYITAPHPGTHGMAAPGFPQFGGEVAPPRDPMKDYLELVRAV